MFAAGTTAAVVVVFRADAPLQPMLQRLAEATSLLLVVDNSVQGLPRVAEAARTVGALLIHGGNQGGLAGAYNHALAALAERQAPPDQVVFLDEDSDPSVLKPLLSDPDVQRLLHSDAVAVVAPAYRDRATGLRGKYLQLQRWRLHYLSRDFQDLQAVTFVINSMAVWRWPALQALGPFNEGLAIDHVDTEMCLRARGLGVYVHGGYEFAHAIGERRRFKFLGHEMQAGGHSPARRWLIARNTVWLARRYLTREPAFAFLCITRLGYEAVGILMAEEQAPAKLWALARGAVQGLFARKLRWTPGQR